MKECSGMNENFYGSVTVGERGQIVIPSEARADLGIEPGDKLLVMKHPIYSGLMVAKIDALREFVDEFARGVEMIDKAEQKEEAKA